MSSSSPSSAIDKNLKDAGKDANESSDLREPVPLITKETFEELAIPRDKDRKRSTMEEQEIKTEIFDGSITKEKCQCLKRKARQNNTN